MSGALHFLAILVQISGPRSLEDDGGRGVRGPKLFCNTGTDLRPSLPNYSGGFTRNHSKIKNILRKEGCTRYLLGIPLLSYDYLNGIQWISNPIACNGECPPSICKAQTRYACQRLHRVRVFFRFSIPYMRHEV